MPCYSHENYCLGTKMMTEIKTFISKFHNVEIGANLKHAKVEFPTNRPKKPWRGLKKS